MRKSVLVASYLLDNLLYGNPALSNKYRTAWKRIKHELRKYDKNPRAKVPTPKDDTGITKLRNRIKEEFECVRDLGHKADIVSAMTNVDSLIKYLLKH